MWPYSEYDYGFYTSRDRETRRRIEQLETSVLMHTSKSSTRETYSLSELHHAIDAYLKIEFAPTEWADRYCSGEYQGPISEQKSNKEVFEKWKADIKKVEAKNNKPWHTSTPNSRGLWEWITRKPISYTN